MILGKVYGDPGIVLKETPEEAAVDLARRIRTSLVGWTDQEITDIFTEANCARGILSVHASTLENCAAAVRALAADVERLKATQESASLQEQRDHRAYDNLEQECDDLRATNAALTPKAEIADELLREFEYAGEESEFAQYVLAAFEQLESTNAALTEELARVKGMGNAFPLHDVLTRLADSAEHLHEHHNCDCQGYEIVQQAITAARGYAQAALRGKEGL